MEIFGALHQLRSFKKSPAEKRAVDRVLAELWKCENPGSPLGTGFRFRPMNI